MTRMMFAAALAIAWTGAPALAQSTGSIVGWEVGSSFPKAR